MDVAPSVAPATSDEPLHQAWGSLRRFEVAVLLEPRIRGRIEIARPADQFGQGARDGLHHCLGRLPCREALGVGRELGEVGGPPFGKLAGESALDLSRELGEVAPIGIELMVPCFFELATAIDRAPEMGQGLVRNVERRLLGPAEVLLRLARLLGAEGAAVRGEGALLVGRAITEHRPHRDQRRPVAHVLGALNRALDRAQVVAVVDLLHVPAVGAVARARRPR